MAKEYTLQELQAMGAKPAPQEYTAEQLQQMQQQNNAPKPQSWQDKAGTMLGNFEYGAVKGITNVSTDLAQGIAGGLGWAASKLPFKGAQQWGQDLTNKAKAIKDTGVMPGAEFASAPSQSFSETAGQAVGKFGSEAAIISAGTPEIAGLKKITSALPYAEQVAKIPFIGKAAGYVTQKVLNSIPEAGFGYGYSKLMGGTDTEAKQTAATFGILSGMGDVVGDTWRAFKGTLPDNITKALGGIKGKGVSEVLGATKKAQDAFTTIKNLAPDIKVIDAAGVEKVFDPAKATFGETLQAFSKTKDIIYKSYTDLAKQAGDKGAAFIKEDFGKVIDAINAEAKDGTTAFKNKAASLIKDLTDNFGLMIDEQGKVTSAADTSFERIQKFIQKVGVDINPNSDKAGAEMSSKTSQSMRKILDDKIMSSTGEGYQKLRTGYSNLLSIEDNLVNQFKKAANNSGSKIAGWVQGLSGVDAIVSLVSGNPVGAAKSLGWNLVADVMKYLKDPETYLQRTFQQIGEVKAPSDASVRAFGGATPAKLPLK
jgi:hypothetical protein